MNQLEKVRLRPLANATLEHGISPLQARIKFMECCLHVAYRLQLRTWRIVGKAEKALVQEYKNRIQGEFRSKLGLKVDFMSEGSGSSNDGNTARNFFANIPLTASITGLDSTLLYRMSSILNVINSKHAIHAQRFGDYCSETARI